MRNDLSPETKAKTEASAFRRITSKENKCSFQLGNMERSLARNQSKDRSIGIQTHHQQRKQVLVSTWQCGMISRQKPRQRQKHRHSDALPAKKTSVRFNLAMRNDLLLETKAKTEASAFRRIISKENK